MAPDAAVKVNVAVPGMNVDEAPDVSQEPVTDMEPLVRDSVFAAASFIVTPDTVIAADIPKSVPPPEMTRLAPPEMPFPAVVNVPVTIRAPVTLTALLWVIVPEAVRLENPLAPFRIVTVRDVPDKVTVLVPFVKVEPAPDVSQSPLTVHDPVVKTMAPEVPEFIVTSTTVTVDAPAVSTPELPTTSEPPPSARPAVSTAVVPGPSWIVRVPPHLRGFVPIVNVTALPAVEANVTLLNSRPTKPAKIIVCDAEELKTTVPVPAPQFEEVLPLDQEPLKVQVPLPIRKYAVGLAMVVAPATLTREAAPEPSRTADPERIRSPATSNPFPVDAPTVMVPEACVTSPLTASVYPPSANVPVQPSVSREVTEAFRSRVAAPPPELASKMTAWAAPGAEHPPAPPDVADQWDVCDQVPAPPTQYRTPAQGAAMITSTTGSEPSIVNTTWPAPSTNPVVKSTPSFVTLKREPLVFPPMVKVSVDVATVDVCVHWSSPSRVHEENTLIVVRLVESLFVTVRLMTRTLPSAMAPLPVSVSPLNVRLCPVIVRRAPSPMASVPRALSSEAREAVPLIVISLNAWPAASLIVEDGPVNATVEVPAFKVEPGPEVSQSPLTDQAPELKVIAPDALPVMDTSATLTADAPAVRAPPSPTDSAPPVSSRSAVARVVVAPPPAMERVPDHARGFPAMVKVTVAAPPLNVTSWNSAVPPGSAANTIVVEEDEVNVTWPVPDDQLVEVEKLVQDPLTVHASEPKAM